MPEAMLPASAAREVVERGRSARVVTLFEPRCGLRRRAKPAMAIYQTHRLRLSRRVGRKPLAQRKPGRDCGRRRGGAPRSRLLRPEATSRNLDRRFSQLNCMSGVARSTSAMRHRGISSVAADWVDGPPTIQMLVDRRGPSTPRTP
jgi:hypothetical protein